MDYSFSNDNEEDKYIENYKKQQQLKKQNHINSNQMKIECNIQNNIEINDLDDKNSKKLMDFDLVDQEDQDVHDENQQPLLIQRYEIKAQNDGNNIKHDYIIKQNISEGVDMKTKDIYKKINQNSFNLHFEDLTFFFERIAQTKSSKKSKHTKKFFEDYLFKSRRDTFYAHSILRLIMPNIDRERGNYNIKEKVLGDLISDALSLGQDIKNKLRHYKNTSYHNHDSPTGDFGEVVYYNLKNFCQINKKQLTVMQLNEYLDQLVVVGDKQKQTDVMRLIIRKATAQQVKWICRIILKDLKIGISFEKMLNFYHPDALEYYNSSSSLLEVCKEFVDINHKLKNVLRLFHPVKPMLANKRQMQQLFNILEGRKILVETKFDGERIQCHFNKEKIMFFSRNSNDYTYVYGNKMANVIKQNIIKTEAAILDGEMIVIDQENNIPIQFGMNKTVAINQDDNNQQSHLKLCYKVFDILYIKGVSGEELITMNEISLVQRKQILRNIITEVPNSIEIVEGIECNDFDDVQKEFREAISKNQEGIILKQHDSFYVPNSRSDSWIKMKGDYFQGLTDTLDLIILGGYFGNQSYRTLTNNLQQDWTDNLTHFLLGIAQKTDKSNPQKCIYLPICKVGTGYTQAQLQDLRNGIRNNWISTHGVNFQKSIPKFVYQNWNPSLQDRPDAFIKNPAESKILEIKAAEIIKSHSWPANFTLRFPRVEKIRYDKDWHECMDTEELKNITSNAEKKRKNSDSGDEDEEKIDNEDNILKDQQKGRKKGPGARKGQKTNDVIEWFKDTDTSGIQPISNLFENTLFCIINLSKNGKYSKQFLEQNIVRYGGQKTQNESPYVNYYIAENYDFKVNTIVNKYDPIVVFPHYIIECITKNKIISLAPRYLLYSNHFVTSQNYQKYDQYGDSYIDQLDTNQLKDTLNQINLSQDDIDKVNYQLQDLKKSVQKQIDEIKYKNKYVYCLYDPENKYLQQQEFKYLRVLVNRNKDLCLITELTQHINAIISIEYNNEEIKKIQEFLKYNYEIEIVSVQDVLQNIQQKQKNIEIVSADEIQQINQEQYQFNQQEFQEEIKTNEFRNTKYINQLDYIKIESDSNSNDFVQNY